MVSGGLNIGTSGKANLIVNMVISIRQSTSKQKLQTHPNLDPS
jgi:hypothetical protein